MKNSEYLMLNGLRIDATLANSEKCFSVIYDKIVSKLISSQINTKHCMYIEKNTQPHKLLSFLESTVSCENKPIITYSYGQHIQRQLSVIEKLKTNLKNNNVEIEQYNYMSCFIQVSTSRNELLEKNINIPLFVVLIAPKGKIGVLERFHKQ